MQLSVDQHYVTWDDFVRAVNGIEARALLHALADHDRRYGDTSRTDHWATYYPPTMALMARVLLTGPKDGRKPLTPGSFPRLLRMGNALVDYGRAELRADPTDAARTAMAIRWAHRSAIEGHWRPYYQFARLYYLLRDGGVWDQLTVRSTVDIGSEVRALYGFDHRSIFGVAFALYCVGQRGPIRRREFFSNSVSAHALQDVLDALLARIMRRADEYPVIWANDKRYQSAAQYPLTAFNPLREFPLVEDPGDPDLLLTPSRFFLMDRMTLGLYYELVEVFAQRKRDKYPNRDPQDLQAYNNEMTTFWGGAIERYVYIQLRQLRRGTVTPAFRYVADGRTIDGPDISVVDNHGVAFVEVKAKTPRLELRASGNLEELEDHFAMGVAYGHVQNLIHINNLRSGLLTLKGVRANDFVQSIVVCPEPVYLFDLPLIRRRFEAAVDRVAEKRKCDFRIRYDCTVLGLDDLETLVPNAHLFGGFCRVIAKYSDYRRSTCHRIAGPEVDFNAHYFVPWFHDLLHDASKRLLPNTLLDAEWQRLCDEAKGLMQLEVERPSTSE